MAEIFAAFETGLGGDPDNRDEGGEAEREARVLEGERNGNQIYEEREPVFAFNSLVLRLKPAGMAQTAADRETQEKKAEASHDHRGNIEGNRTRVHLLFEHVRGEKRQERQAEEESKVGVEDQLIGLMSPVNELMVVDP